MAVNGFSASYNYVYSNGALSFTVTQNFTSGKLYVHFSSDKTNNSGWYLLGDITASTKTFTYDRPSSQNNYYYYLRAVVNGVTYYCPTTNAGNQGWWGPLSWRTYPTNPSISVTRTSRNNYTVSWSGGANGGENKVNGVQIIRNNSKSTSGAVMVYSADLNGPSSGTVTSYASAGNYCFGIRYQGNVATGDYTWWNGLLSIPSHPTVSAGSPITKAQMDSLKSYINTTTPTTVSQGGTIYASHGTTYSSVSAGSAIDDIWYNNA